MLPPSCSELVRLDVPIVLRAHLRFQDQILRISQPHIHLLPLTSLWSPSFRPLPGLFTPELVTVARGKVWSNDIIRGYPSLIMPIFFV